MSPESPRASNHRHKLRDLLPALSLSNFLPTQGPGAAACTSPMGRIQPGVSITDCNSRSMIGIRSSNTGRPSGVVCPYCSKWCPCKAEMDRHIRTHTGERPYKCHLCSYSATVKCTLQNHLRAKHEILNKIWCTYAGRNFFKKRIRTRNKQKYEYERKTKANSIDIRHYFWYLSLSLRLRHHSEDVK